MDTATLHPKVFVTDLSCTALNTVITQDTPTNSAETVPLQLNCFGPSTILLVSLHGKSSKSAINHDSQPRLTVTVRRIKYSTVSSAMGLVPDISLAVTNNNDDKFINVPPEPKEDDDNKPKKILPGEKDTTIFEGKRVVIMKHLLDVNNDSATWQIMAAVPTGDTSFLLFFGENQGTSLHMAHFDLALKKSKCNFGSTTRTLILFSF